MVVVVVVVVVVVLHEGSNNSSSSFRRTIKLPRMNQFLHPSEVEKPFLPPRTPLLASKVTWLEWLVWYTTTIGAVCWREREAVRLPPRFARTNVHRNRSNSFYL